MPDNTLSFTTRVDTTGLREGMAQAASTVQSSAAQMAAAMQAATVASDRLAEAQKKLGASAAGGNEQAVAILAQYQAEAVSAAAAVEQLAGAQTTQTIAAGENAVANDAAAAATERVGVSARQGAAAGIGILEGRMMSGNRAAAAFLSTTLGLGPVIEAAFPIIGAVALGEVLVDVAGKIANLYDEFVNLRSIQNEVYKQLAQGESEAITLSNEHLRLLREQQVLQAETSGGKTGRTARGEEAGANFDLTKSKNDLVILNAQIGEFQARVADLQKRANAPLIQPPQRFDQIGTPLPSEAPSQSEDAKLATIELAKAEQDLDNALAQQQNLRTGIANSALQGDLRQSQAAEAAAAAAKTAESQQLASQQATGRLIDEEAKKEEERYKKLDEIKNRASESMRTIKPDEEDASSGAIDSYVESQIKLNDAKIQAYQIDQDNANSLAEATIRAQAALGTTTALGAAQAMAAQHAKEYKQQLAALNAQLKVYENAGKDVEAAQTRNQISQVQGRKTVTAVNDKSLIDQQAMEQMMQGANQISTVWMGAFDNILRGGRGAWDAVQKAGEQTVLGLINGAERMALNWVEMDIKRVVSHQIGNQTVVTSDAAAAAETTAISKKTAISGIQDDAAAVFASVYKSLAGVPVVGPVIAPIGAAGAYAAVIAMAAFEEGTTYVPRTGMALIHEGEAIFPRPQAEQFRNFLSGGGNNGQSSRGGTIGGINNLNFTYHGTHSGTKTDARSAMREFHKQLRRQGLVQ